MSSRLGIGPSCLVLCSRVLRGPDGAGEASRAPPAGGGRAGGRGRDGGGGAQLAGSIVRRPERRAGEQRPPGRADGLWVS